MPPQDALGVPRGTIRATVLIETIFGAFEMDVEILYELRLTIPAGASTAAVGITFSASSKNSVIYPSFMLPNRSEVTMDRHFLKSYSELLIKTFHRRNNHSMCGMAAKVPVKNDPVANQRGVG